MDKLTTYGLMKEISRQQVRDYVEYLESIGYLRTDTIHGSVDLTPMSEKVLFKDERVLMSIKKQIIVEKTHTAEKKRVTKSAHPATETNPGLFDALKALRFKLAQEEGVPAYIVFSNANLADMAQKAPKTMAEFKEVSGVGEIKAARYGEIFLNAIAKFEAGET